MPAIRLCTSSVHVKFRVEKSVFQDTQMETHRLCKDNVGAPAEAHFRNYKNQPWRCLCFGSALQITRMTPSRLTILQLRHNFLTEARTITLRNFSGDQLWP